MNDIVGTWRLVETRAHDDAGRPMHPPYGPQPMGVVVFSIDRRMICVLCDPRPDLPPGGSEREYNSYCGAYTFDGSTLVTRVDACSDPARMGSDQVRRVRFEANRTRADAAAASLAGRGAAPRAVLGKSRVSLRRRGRLDVRSTSSFIRPCR